MLKYKESIHEIHQRKMNRNKQKVKKPKTLHTEEKMQEFLNQSHLETSKETQETLNKPLVSPEEISKEDEKFLEMVIKMIGDGRIDLYKTSSLMNLPIYNKLTPKAKAQAELDALNLLNTLRQIYKLYQSKLTDTYQFKNMLNQFRLTKERIEEEAGDIYII